MLEIGISNKRVQKVSRKIVILHDSVMLTNIEYDESFLKAGRFFKRSPYSNLLKTKES